MLKMRKRLAVLRHATWSPDLKVWRNWLKPGISWVRLVTGGVSRSWILQLATFAKFAAQLGRRQGVKGLVLYLKTAQVLLMQNLSGSKARFNSRKVGKVAIAVASDGLPRVIPRFARDGIRRGSKETLRLWLTFFGLYRILKFVGKPKLETILAKGTPFSRQFRNEWFAFARTGFLPMISEFWGRPLVTQLPAELLSRPEPLIITGSSADSTKLVVTNVEGEVVRTVYDSSFASRFNSATRWMDGDWGVDLWVFLSFLTGGVATTKSLYTKLMETAEAGQRYKGLSRGEYPKDFSPRGSEYSGRLACLPEAAGKVRVIALLDYWSQAALKPLHSFIFELLRTIPTDGTFDQLAPVNRLLRKIDNKTVVYSYDLSAATDRLSIKAQMLLLSCLFHPRFAVAWKRLLVNRKYWLWTGKKYRALVYAQGQPMGGYSSWGMLALTHHMMVQFAAYKAGYRKFFDLYAVLGDDVVIAHCAVAGEYVKVCKQLGVEIGIAKSLISTGKTLEFAKKFFRNGEDCSGLPMKFWAAAQSSMGVAQALTTWYPTKGSLFNFVRALGAGFKGPSALGSSWGKIPRRLRVLAVFLTHPLGGGTFAFKTWPEWLWSWGPIKSKLDRLDTVLTQFTPFATAMLEEVVAPVQKILDRYQEDLFFTESVEDPCARAAKTQVNLAVAAAEKSLNSAEKALKHLQRLNIKFMLHQVSAVLTQVTRMLEKAELVPSPPNRAMVKQNEETQITKVLDLYRYWSKLRNRVLSHAARKVGAKELSG